MNRQWAWLLLVLFGGCGLTKSRQATEQLVMSDAVDRAIAQIDFSDLAGHKVFLDTKYVTAPKTSPGPGQPPVTTNVDYVISSLRQQMVAYQCRLQDKADQADYIVEPRVGALGNEGHEVTFGIPATSGVGFGAIGSAAGLTGIPGTPEMSVGRKNHQMAAAKIGVFAYHRETGRPVWQAGVATATSNARDLWVFANGPYQRGSLYEKKKKENTSWAPSLWPTPEPEPIPDSLAAYRSEIHFEKPNAPQAMVPLPPVQQATHVEKTKTTTK
jgi:hypothetical protein